MSTTVELWVLQLDNGYTVNPNPYYARAPFSGGTYNLEEAQLFETEPKSLVGHAVPVKVTTTVEVVTHG